MKSATLSKTAASRQIDLANVRRLAVAKDNT